jgi:hypothetical protein
VGNRTRSALGRVTRGANNAVNRVVTGKRQSGGRRRNTRRSPKKSRKSRK